MSFFRRFLISPALARLVRKERGAGRLIEGFFPPAQGRTSFVRVEGGQCHLVLVGAGEGAKEERTEVPRAHGDALLEACAGRAIFDRSRVALGQGRDAAVDHFTKPGRLDLVSVCFETADESAAFTAPVWFGPEVTGNPAYENRALAIDGVPSAAEVQPSNTALDGLLDGLESRLGLSRYGGSAQRLSPEDPRVLDAMRRLTTNPTLAAPARAPTSGPEGRGEARLAPVLPAPAASAPPAPVTAVSTVALAAAVPAPPAPGTAVPTAPAPAPAVTAPPAAEAAAPPEPPSPEPVAAAAEAVVTPDAEPANDASPMAQDEGPAPELDSRMNDVIHNLSQALGAATAAEDEAQAPGEAGGEPVFGFGRWSVRARRAQE